MDTHPTDRPVVSLSSGVIALLAAWLVVCPWVIGAPGPRIANTGMVCGVLILICSAVRFLRRHTAAMSWINALLGAWLIGAAWVFGENSGDVHTWNYTIVGVVIAGLETLSLTASAMRPHTVGGSEVSTGRLPGTELIEAAETFFAATGAIVGHGGNRAFYSSGLDVIQLPVPEAFRDA